MNTVFLAWLQGPEVVVIFILVLLLFGAKKLPELARGLGKSMGEFRRAKEEFESEIHRAGEEVQVEAEKKKQQYSGAKVSEEIAETSQQRKSEDVPEKSTV